MANACEGWDCVETSVEDVVGCWVVVVESVAGDVVSLEPLDWPEAARRAGNVASDIARFGRELFDRVWMRRAG